MKQKTSSQQFDNFIAMSQSAKNWDIHCAYQFFPHGSEGEHHIIELPSMQLSYSYRKGGFMHSAISPKGFISIAVVEECKGIAFFDRIKLSKGDILFFDDSRAYNFMSKDEIKVAIISISNTKVNSLQTGLYNAIGHYMKDSESILTIRVQKILEEFTHNELNLDTQKIENEITALLAALFEKQTPKTAKLTKGEKTVLQILEQIYGHMDTKVSIESLAKQYKVSKHTLQKSFKSLFGFTPKRFLRLLKLNHAHNDLKYADASSSSVTRIAQKWGFNHMGRFSYYYTELFGENPSLTLKKTHIPEKSMTNECASRQDEMEI